MSGFKITQEEKEKIRKQHELAEIKEKEKKEIYKKGLQKP